MCGIAGWMDQTIQMAQKQDVFKEMGETLQSRGPDDQGYYLRSSCGLLHRRLAIQDPKYAKQPMIANVDGVEYALVYNGQLYNKKELQQELKQNGYQLQTDSDTEVILFSYIEWGVESFLKFNGIYAFAIYRSDNEELILVRDRLGVKPLFFYEYEEGILFGSLIRTLLAHPYVEPVIDETGLKQIFLLGPGRMLGSGVFKGIEEVLPGEYLIYHGGDIHHQIYWKLEAKEHVDNLEETLAHVKYLVMDSIQQQLISDVGYGTFLSGGLDSSIVSKVAAEHCEKLDTYYIRYAENEKYFESSRYQPNQDEDYIQRMVDEIQGNHHEVVITHQQLFDSLLDAMKARDLPGMADIDSSFYLFCQAIKQQETVMLSGECADEIFGGYPWYHQDDILWQDQFPWMTSIELRKKIVKEGVLTNEDDFLAKLYNETIMRTPYLLTDDSKDIRMRQMFYLNIYWFMQTLLDRSDRMSMAWGVEVRVPFCDYRLVEYCFNMPWEMKSLFNQEKGILRHAMEGFLPVEILNRKKSPYPKTHHPEYWKLLVERMYKILQEDGLLTYLVNADVIYEIMDHPETIETPWYGQLMKAPQLLAYLIQVDGWLKYYQVRIER
ncbi:MAG: asparagine synthase (glutamine-hydrolyzing) [Erysipelotrichaceae bacterium]|nr:asparagine synthase (glutamine-hydrolyzing) [Erysipelotrichaceae bacterium]